MLSTLDFRFDTKGRIDIFGSINAQRVIKMCVMHARRKKTRKPCKWRYVSTLTDVA